MRWNWQQVAVTSVVVLLAACSAVSVAQQTAPTAIQAGTTQEIETVRLGQERRIAFNTHWRFAKGDAAGAERSDFDDFTWRKLELPHDWAIEGPFDKSINAHTGGLPVSGVAWYRKRFVLEGAPGDRHLSIEFDGAMSNAKVWLNGSELGSRPYGYIGFAFDLTPALRPAGQENVLAVRLAPEENSSRWYPGAGIYRNVWLDVTGPVRVARFGTYVTTPEITDRKADVAIVTEVRNRGARAVEITIDTSLLDADGKQVAHAERRGDIAAADAAVFSQKLVVADPRRWDVDHPYLYTAITVIRDATTTLDRYETLFGIRTVEFDAKQGMLLNGRHLKLKGVCMHHDLGALGAAVSRRATERQLEIMKAMGANAIRTSHNPPSPEQLEFCDRLGLLVMDEAFDMWRTPKVPNGLSKFFDEWGQTDLADMIRRDRNHPSVVMWSIGNEIPEQNQAEGWKVAKMLTDICHKYDPTRPVTAGFNQLAGAIRNGLADQVDIPGFNYQPRSYARLLEEHPKWIIVCSESSSVVSSRGVYHLPLEKYEKHPSLQLSSYDIISPSWAYAPDVEFDAQDRLPNVLGEFVWTGFDYLGEPTPFNWSGVRRQGANPDWPSRSSYFGIVDLCGFPKDRFYLYQSVWSDKPMVHILPHWNWQGREGQPIPMFAYTNADEVELFLNGKSLGRKARFSEPVVIPIGPNVSQDRKFSTKYRLQWEVPYAPGLLRAVAYQRGAQVADKAVRTAGEPARLALIADRARIAADGDDLSFVTVRVEDKDGNLCPEAANLVQFKLEGPGRIAAVDNGNAASVESFQANERTAFSGLCMLIVRSNRGAPGSIQIEATSPGLAAARTFVVTELQRN